MPESKDDLTSIDGDQRITKFDEPWWGLHQTLAWVAVRGREAADTAGVQPGCHVFAAINNTDGRRMNAAMAQLEIHNALSDGRLPGVRLENRKAIPVGAYEWAGIPFDLSEAGSGGLRGIWWLNYRLSSAAVRNLWRSAEDENAAAVVGSDGAKSTEPTTPDRRAMIESALRPFIKDGFRLGPWKAVCEGVRDTCNGWADKKKGIPAPGFDDRTIKRTSGLK